MEVRAAATGPSPGEVGNDPPHQGSQAICLGKPLPASKQEKRERGGEPGSWVWPGSLLSRLAERQGPPLAPSPPTLSTQNRTFCSGTEALLCCRPGVRSLVPAVGQRSLTPTPEGPAVHSFTALLDGVPSPHSSLWVQGLLSRIRDGVSSRSPRGVDTGRGQREASGVLWAWNARRPSGVRLARPGASGGTGTALDLPPG